MKTTKYALAVSLVLVGLTVVPAAWADSIVFNVSGTFVDGSILTGTVTLDTISGQVTAGNLQDSLTVTPFTLTFQAPEGAAPFYAINTNDPTLTEFIQLILPQTGPSNLAGFSGGQLCSQTFHCILNVAYQSATDIVAGSSNTFNPLQSGTLTPAPVPEPSSLLLLGTGLLGLAGGMRRKRPPADHDAA